MLLPHACSYHKFALAEAGAFFLKLRRTSKPPTTTLQFKPQPLTIKALPSKIQAPSPLIPRLTNQYLYNTLPRSYPRCPNITCAYFCISLLIHAYFCIPLLVFKLASLLTFELTLAKIRWCLYFNTVLTITVTKCRVYLLMAGAIFC